MGLSISCATDRERDLALVFLVSTVFGSREFESPDGGTSRSLVYWFRPVRFVGLDVPFPLFLFDDRDIDASGAGGVETADIGVGGGSSALSDSI